jgi:ParB/RepB/Spo0J family partition protein
MNTISKYYKELEHHAIEMTLSHIRIIAPAQLKKLIASIDTHGQLSPVVVVPTNQSNRYTLMDGYLRVQAMKKLRQDIVKAEIWECSEADALVSLLIHQGQRTWEVFEEAQALRELQTRYGLSQEQISKQIGRTQSWISHRLSLLSTLTEPFIDAVIQGKISAWSAQRVLVPIARAIPLHAEYLLKYLTNHTHSTREQSKFLQHYQKSNKSVREEMVMQPDLFFKAQEAIKIEKEAAQLKSGPEGQWQFRLSNIADQIKHMEKLVPLLFYERQEEKNCLQLLLPLEQIQDRLNRILITSRRQYHDRQNETASCYNATSIREELSAH